MGLSLLKIFGFEVYINMCACMPSHFSRVQLFATQWTIPCQAPLSMGFSRQEYRSGLPCPPPGDLPTQGSNPCLLSLLHCKRILSGRNKSLLSSGHCFRTRVSGRERGKGEWYVPCHLFICWTCVSSRQAALMWLMPRGDFLHGVITAALLPWSPRTLALNILLDLQRKYLGLMCPQSRLSHC